MKITIDQFRNSWQYLVFTPLYLISCSISFLIQEDGSIISRAALAAYLILIMIGLLPGILMVLGGNIIRIIIATLTLSTFVYPIYKKCTMFLPKYMQAEYLLLGLMVIIIGMILYGLRHHLAQFLCAIFVVFFIVVLFTPREPFINQQIISQPEHNLNKSLPPYIHIILDEHIGIEGIDKAIDSDMALSNELKNIYIAMGFKVYGKAYSRYYISPYSFASFLNLKPIDNFNGYITQQGRNYTLTKNTMFELLAKQGYKINVLQNKYLNLCNDAKTHSIVNCSTYKLTALMSKNIAVDDIITHAIISPNLSKIYELIRTKFFINAILPSCNYIIPYTRPSGAVTAYRLINEMSYDFKPGNAYFLHFLLPHRAYVFDKQCRSVANSSVNMQAYSDQIKCAHSLVRRLFKNINNNPDLKNATILIHSDHGSRIARNSNMLNDPNYYLQLYSAFFAVKSPKFAAGYDQQPLPLDILVKNIFTVTDNITVQEKSGVYLNNANSFKVTYIDLPF